MQPRKLTMKNFGPFIQEELDFQDFENTGIFLISGKTGSGKTTIFDGMTYALFGQTSGKLRSGKEMRSLFASPAEETEVTFNFEHGGIVYEIQRRPEQVLNKKRGTGQTTRAAKTILTVFDEQGEPKEQFTKNVDNQISELLHLTADQFFKIIMLPQGEFRNFLIASSLDKEQVLRKLFDTEIYQDLNEWLEQLTAEKEGVIAQQQARGVAIQEYFRWSGEAPASLSLAETNDYWEADLALLKEQRQLAEAELKQTAKTVSDAEKAFYAGQELQQRFTELQELTQRQAELVLEEAQIQELEQETERLDWLKENRRLIQNVAAQEQGVSALTQQLTELAEQIADNQQKLSAWQERRQEMTTLTQQVAEAQNELTRKQALLPLAEKAAQLALQQQTAAKEADLRQQKLAKLQSEEQKVQQQLTELDERLQEQAQWQQEELLLVKLQQAVTRWQELAKTVTTIEAKAQKLQAEEQGLIDRQETLTLQLAEAESAHQRVKSDNAKLQIARLSLDLLPGEPCPVCGALEHPKAAAEHQRFTYEEIQASEAALAASEEQVTRYQGQIAETSGSLIEVQKRRNQLEEDRRQGEQTAESAYLAVIELQGTEVPKNTLAEVVAKRQSAHDQQGAELKQAQQQSLELTPRSAELTQKITEVKEEQQLADKQLQGILGQQETLNEQLQGVTPDALTATIAALQETIQQGTQTLAADTTEGETLARNELVYNQQQADRQQQLTETTTRLQQEREALDQAIVAGPAKVEALLLQDTEAALVRLPQLQETIKDFRQQQAFVEKRSAELQEKLAEQQAPALAELEEELQEIRSLQKQQQEASLRLKDQEANNRKLLRELQKLIDESRNQLQELSELQQLRDTINGKNAFKTSLERYVLQAYLAEILEVANQRLQRLSKGRYQFELAEKEIGGRGQKGLDIDIYDDDAGATRRVQTLSGGESFIAALALALSLADVIQNRSGGIPIEALFIDEGFGSLDEEALEMALEALASIEAEGRMIGIISHVGQLKERITRQVLVDADGTGQSHIRTKL